MRDHEMMPSQATGSRPKGRQPAAVVRRNDLAGSSPHAGARAHAARLNRAGAARSMLALQQSYGNRFARQVAAVANSASEARKVQVKLAPHPESATALRAMEPVYREGKTPVVDMSGNVSKLDVRPADAAATAGHLQTIRTEFGQRGLRQTIEGLAATRGMDFVDAAIRSAAAQGANVGYMGDEPMAGRGVAGALASSSSTQSLPATLRDRVAAMTGDKLEDVRLHNDTAAHTAASLMGARAFTVGRDIYFAAGEFQPSSRAGLALVAHEAAHTIQQKNATRPAMDSLPVGAQGDAHEREAEHFAAAVCGDATPAPLSIAPSLSVARVQRAISFSSSNHAVAKNTMGVTETAAGFQIQPNATPLFNWTADVTIRGNAGDVFGDWDVGPHQVVRHLYNNVYWGSGANQGHRLLQVSPVPIRDATAAGNTWYHDPLAAAGYAASGDVLNTGLNDSPQTGVHPWANPVPGKAGNSGYFNYGAAFVAYISARHIPTGTGAAAFRAINSRYWNVSITGTFDAAQPLGTRVTASGGTVSNGGVIDGGSSEFPSMHGGDIANNRFTTTDS